MFKKLLLYLCRGLLSSFLLLLPAAFLCSFVFSQASQVKELAQQSGVYSLIAQTIVDSTVSSLTHSNQTYGLSKDALTRAAKKAFPASDIQRKGDRLIDDTYLWLDNKKPNYQPSFDIESNQKVFSQALADEASKAIAIKPVCTQAQLIELAANGDIGILQISCRPSTLDANYLKTFFEQSSSVTLQNLPQSPNSVLPGVSTQSNTSTHSSVQTTDTTPQFIFSLFKNSFYTLLALIIVLLLAIIMLIREQRRCLVVIAKPVLVMGVLLMIYAWLLAWLNEQHFLTKTLSDKQADIFQAVAQPFMQLSIKANLYFGLGYTVGALVLFLIYRASKPKQQAILQDALVASELSVPTPTLSPSMPQASGPQSGETRSNRSPENRIISVPSTHSF